MVRLLEGSRSRRLPKPSEMAIVCPGVPPAPEHLSGLALEHWNYLTEHLGRASLLELIDSAALEAACVAYGRAVAADQQVAQEGITFIDPEKGTPRKNPACSVSLEAWTQYRHFALEFGLTPCSRAKLRMPKPNKEVDDFDSFVKQA